MAPLAKEISTDRVTKLVDLEVRLASVSFQNRGCIYDKADLKTDGALNQQLQATNFPLGGSPKDLGASLLDKFALDLLIEAVLCEGERSTMASDRGSSGSYGQTLPRLV